MNNLTLGPRPKLKNIPKLTQRVIFTLLNPEEGPEIIKHVALECGKAWVGCPLDARGHSTSDWPKWLAAVEALELLLKKDITVYLHCAAGIHRTGSLAYLYFRRQGYSVGGAKKLVFELRPVIKRDIGNKMATIEAMYKENTNGDV